jgi:predicted ATPase/class 3 adenylate cyclase
VTFLFTDIEGSTRLWEEHRLAMAEMLERHDRILAEAIAAADGMVFSTGGDGLAAAFQRAPDALQAALHAQLALASERWDPPLHVRMALHTGNVEERRGDYFGPPLNRCARLLATAHGGQVLCSGVTAALARDQLPVGTRLVDLGEHRLRDLSDPEHVFQLDHPGVRSEFPALRSLDAYRGNLPLQPTTFVGRDIELGELAKALEESRVLTLSGVGGVGKTRLAIQLAADVVPRFADGAWLVELASVGHPDSLDEAVGSALGVRQRPGTTMRQSVVDYLRHKSLLLVLDNCEHLLSAVAGFVEAAIAIAPALRVLATSREGLAIAGERITTVPSLELPTFGMTPEATLETEAVKLFTDRARETDAAFIGGPEEASVMAELCRRLDGIPLAIELAAARVRGMTPAEINDHLDRRFRLLTRGRRTASPRHQTLRNTIDWSYELLDDLERTVLRRLGTFHGSFTMDAAEAIVAGDAIDAVDVVDLLLRLVDKSLVVSESRSGISRYRLFETVREYALERLEAADELDDVAARHARHYVELAERAGLGLEGPDELVWRARVEEDLANLRGALRWAIDVGDVDLALSEVEALSTVGSLRSPPFGLMAFEVARMAGADRHELQPMALGAVCMTFTQQGAVEQALEFAAAAETSARRLWTDSARHTKLRCRLRGCITTAIAYSGDFARLIELARDELTDARTINDRLETCRALTLLSSVLGPDRNDEAIQCGEEALCLAKEVANPSYMAWAPMMLAGRLAATDPARAEALFDEAVRAADAADNDFARSQAFNQLAAAQAQQHDYLAASRSLVEMVSRARATGDQGTVQSGMGFLACLLAIQNEQEAALLVGAWTQTRGFHVSETSTDARFFAFGVGSYVAMRQRQSEEALRAIRERAQTMDEVQVLDVVRHRLQGVADGQRERTGALE